MKFIAGIAGALLFVALPAPPIADAKGSSSGHSSSRSYSHSHGSGSKAVQGVPRDTHGKIKGGTL